MTYADAPRNGGTTGPRVAVMIARGDLRSRPRWELVLIRPEQDAEYLPRSYSTREAASRAARRIANAAGWYCES